MTKQNQFGATKAIPTRKKFSGARKRWSLSNCNWFGSNYLELKFIKDAQMCKLQYSITINKTYTLLCRRKHSWMKTWKGEEDKENNLLYLIWEYWESRLKLRRPKRLLFRGTLRKTLKFNSDSKVNSIFDKNKAHLTSQEMSLN